jgi:RNA polymerase sigma-70 factor (ECF subfamily)
VSLVGRVAAGDERAMGALYDLTSRRVFALALQILKDRGAAEEATLDVFTQVWRQAGRYEPTKGTPLGWLLTMTRSRAIDLVRTQKRRTEREAALDEALSVPDGGANPEDLSLEAQDSGRIRSALAVLPAEQREALVAAYFGGLSHTEVASAQGLPLGTVKTRIRSGLIHLRRLLAEHGDPVS